MLRVFPQLQDVAIDYAWGGTLAITMKRLPASGRLDGDVFYAMGFSGQGVALTTLAGKVIAEAVAGQAERFDVLAEVPTRSEEHTSELQSLMRISYAVFCLKKK